MIRNHSFAVYFTLILLTVQACGGGDPTSTSDDPVDTTPPVITLTGSSTINHEQGTSFIEPGVTAVDDVDGSVVVITSGTVEESAGTYILTYTAQDSAGNTSTASRNVIVEDTTAPEITLIGSPMVNHEQATQYVDAGATATDIADGNLSVEIAGSVGEQAGTYTLIFSAQDSAGHSATTSRIVTVSDTTTPVITLLGSALVNHELGATYTDAGATAEDTVDGSISVSVSGNVEDEAGTYILTYSASDSSGNVATKTRTVVVGDGNTETDLVVFDNGTVGTLWDKGINAFDEAIGFGECNNDNGVGCPSISWQIATDETRGDVLEISHSETGNLAGVFIAINGVVDLSDNTDGKLIFDIKVISGDSKITMKLDCIYPCTSGDQLLGSKGASDWETVEVSLATLVEGGLNLASVNTGIVIWASDATSTVFQLDNVRFSGINDGGSVPSEYVITGYGAGSISDTINPDSYRCVYDFGNWIYNAGIVEPAIAACNTETGIPSGTPTPIHPQLSGPAENEPTPSHKWWGSIPFHGEMRIGEANDAAYITPDPITARITEKGVRIMSIPGGLRNVDVNNFYYPIPDPFSEVFDGVAIGNSVHSNLDAYLKDHSDGSVTVEWQSDDEAVMEATFIHGSPYVYFKAYKGELVVRTLREDGGEKGTFYNQGNSLGVWTNVAGNSNHFLITGEGSTTFTNPTSNEITVSNSAKALTLTYLPHSGVGTPDNALIEFFETYARNEVAEVNIDFTVQQSDNSILINHQYRDSLGEPVNTIVGMHPLHWKNSSQPTSSYKIRSARGIIKFSQTDQFNYQIPSVGVLPTLPSIDGTFDQSTLENLVTEFIDKGPALWNINHEGNIPADAYWSGKNYGKVAELTAIADSIGMTVEATQLRNWLQSELEDWFSAETNGSLDVEKYFVYDEEWNTLLAMEESFASHQQLNDHHFHYGYLVRAAAEICRHDATWCNDDQYGAMIELLIRDYAGGRDDDMFPYLRNFDPANGFSWASGNVNFVRGNNNESTSEAATSYGAIVLYGLITGKQDLFERGMYLHASTAAAYWEYWNNIDGYNKVGEDEDNFPDGYDRITTSIIWGDGGVFSTWFSPAFAHILGIQGLPSSPLILHVSQHSDYMDDYVALGLEESSNGKPSGLPDDQWQDLWWNLWAMVDADSAIADYETVGSSYTPEVGETKAHTYHWMHTFSHLGHLATGTGELTSNYPAALAFENDGTMTYVVYNFGNETLTVNYSDGHSMNAEPNTFTVITQN